MAAAPPPFSPRDARRQAREYRRAQKQQWRAMRSCRRCSFMGPLVLVAAGVIALLIETGHMSAAGFWSWYAHWWPVLLIVAGVVSLAEYFLDRENPYAGHRSIGGVVWLILLLGGLGWVAHNGQLVGPFAWQFNDNDDSFSWMGPEHDNNVQIDKAFQTAQPSVNVEDPRGDVTITASTDGQMHLRAHQMVHGSAEDAQKLFRQVQPRVTTSSSGAVITVPDKDGTQVDLTLELPAQAFTTVNANHGDVTLEGLQGNADVTAGHGDVKFEDMKGDVHARMDHGDLSAHAIGGHVLADGRGEDVTLSEIAGQVTINGDFFGDVHVEQVESSVHYHSSVTDLDLPKLTGTMTLDNSDLTISGVTGPVRIRARSKDVAITGITGDLQLDDSNGDVNVAAGLPLGNIEIDDRTGSVALTVPENANFSVNGSTSEDENLETDFPLAVNTSGGRRTIAGTVGSGGVKIQISTDHGNLELRKGDAGMVAPAPPSPPPAPKGPVKRFHAPGAVPEATE